MAYLVMLPEEWIILQKKLKQEHPAIWKELQRCNTEQGISLLNKYLDCSCTTAMNYQQVAEAYLKALMKKQRPLILPGDV